MNDFKNHEHGQEGTHFACKEITVRDGGNAQCCGCTAHACKEPWEIEFFETFKIPGNHPGDDPTLPWWSYAVMDFIRRIREEAAAEEQDAILKILEDEIALAHTTISGKTSRLTSAYNRIRSRHPQSVTERATSEPLDPPTI